MRDTVKVMWYLKHNREQFTKVWKVNQEIIQNLLQLVLKGVLCVLYINRYIFLMLTISKMDPFFDLSNNV